MHFDGNVIPMRCVSSSSRAYFSQRALRSTPDFPENQACRFAAATRPVAPWKRGGRTLHFHAFPGLFATHGSYMTFL
jgi:hypothetical protein